MKYKSLFTVLVILVAIFSYDFSVFAQMSSTNFQIQWDAIKSGGSDTSSSSSYIVRDSFDTSAGGQETSTSYKLDQGYRAGVYDRVADFEVFLQDRSTQVSATSVSSTTITVSSVSGFSVGDAVILVEEEGESQVAAIGKISSINDPDIIIDEWHYASSMPNVDGSDDYLYALNGSSVALAEPTVTTVSTAVIGWEVSSDVADGYSVYVYESGGLTNGDDIFSDVTDGSVTAGSREYGARSSDASLASSLFDTQDVGITSSLQQVGSRSENGFTTRDFLTLKLSADGFESSGSYSHVITVIYVGDY